MFSVTEAYFLHSHYGNDSLRDVICSTYACYFYGLGGDAISSILPGVFTIVAFAYHWGRTIVPI